MRANRCWCILLAPKAEEDLMYSTEDLDSLTIDQVEVIHDSEQRALGSAVQMHESYLAARAATRATTRFLSDYLHDRRASASELGFAELPLNAEQARPDVGHADTIDDQRAEEAARKIQAAPTESADDDLPFDDEAIDEGEEETEAG